MYNVFREQAETVLCKAGVKGLCDGVFLYTEEASEGHMIYQNQIINASLLKDALILRQRKPHLFIKLCVYRGILYSEITK